MTNNSTYRVLSGFAILLLAAVISFDSRALAADVKDYSKADVPAGFKAFTDSKARFNISHPADWTAKPDEQGVSIMATDNSSNIKIQVIEVGETPLKAIVAESRTGLENSVKNIKFLSDGPAAFGSREAHHWVFTGDFGLSVELGQLLFIDGSRLFIVSYGSEPSKWEKHSAVCQQIIASLKPGK